MKKEELLIEIDQESLKKFKTLCRQKSRKPKHEIIDYINYVLANKPILFLEKIETIYPKRQIKIRVELEKAKNLREFCRSHNMSVETLIDSFIEAQIKDDDIA